MISSTVKDLKLPLESLKWGIIIILILAIATIGILTMASREKGESFITIQVKVEAKATGRNPCDILAEWLEQAKRAGDTQLALKIEASEKFMGCRNQQKREQR